MAILEFIELIFCILYNAIISKEYWDMRKADKKLEARQKSNTDKNPTAL